MPNPGADEIPCSYPALQPPFPFYPLTTDEAIEVDGRIEPSLFAEWVRGYFHFGLLLGDAESFGSLRFRLLKPELKDGNQPPIPKDGIGHAVCYLYYESKPTGYVKVKNKRGVTIGPHRKGQYPTRFIFSFTYPASEKYDSKEARQRSYQEFILAKMTHSNISMRLYETFPNSGGSANKICYDTWLVIPSLDPPANYLYSFECTSSRVKGSNPRGTMGYGVVYHLQSNRKMKDGPCYWDSDETLLRTKIPGDLDYMPVLQEIAEVTANAQWALLLQSDLLSDSSDTTTLQPLRGKNCQWFRETTQNPQGKDADTISVPSGCRISFSFFKSDDYCNTIGQIQGQFKNPFNLNLKLDIGFAQKWKTGICNWTKSPIVSIRASNDQLPGFKEVNNGPFRNVWDWYASRLLRLQMIQRSSTTTRSKFENMDEKLDLIATLLRLIKSFRSYEVYRPKTRETQNAGWMLYDSILQPVDQWDKVLVDLGDTREDPENLEIFASASLTDWHNAFVCPWWRVLFQPGFLRGPDIKDEDELELLNKRVYIARWLPGYVTGEAAEDSENYYPPSYYYTRVDIAKTKARRAYLHRLAVLHKRTKEALKGEEKKKWPEWEAFTATEWTHSNNVPVSADGNLTAMVKMDFDIMIMFLEGPTYTAATKFFQDTNRENAELKRRIKEWMQSIKMFIGALQGTVPASEFTRYERLSERMFHPQLKSTVEKEEMMEPVDSETGLSGPCESVTRTDTSYDDSEMDREKYSDRDSSIDWKLRDHDRRVFSLFVVGI